MEALNHSSLEISFVIAGGRRLTSLFYWAAGCGSGWSAAL